MQRYAQNHPSPPGLGAWLSAGTLILAVALGIVLLRPLFQAPLSPQELALEEERIESFGRFNLGERRELSSLPEEPLQVEPAFETTRPLDPAPTVQEENLEPHFFPGAGFGHRFGTLDSGCF